MFIGYNEPRAQNILEKFKKLIKCPELIILAYEVRLDCGYARIIVYKQTEKSLILKIKNLISKNNNDKEI